MSSITPEDIQKGQIILINKPKTWTSFDVVNKMRSDVRHTHQIPFAKIGHAGSLDPLATGLLIVCLGRQATKQIDSFQSLEKEYTGTMMLGVTTPSFDLETEINERHPIDHITEKLIKATVKKFIGDIWQYPPIFSAKKVNGERAYHIARNGGHAEVKPVLLHIKKFEITDISLPIVEFKVICSKGTYIRSLANDFGRQLGCGAVLTSLCRTRIGKYKLRDACELKTWMNKKAPTEEKTHKSSRKRIAPGRITKKTKVTTKSKKQSSKKVSAKTKKRK